MPYNYHELKKKFFLRSKKIKQFYHCIGLNKTTAPRDLSIFNEKNTRAL